MRYEVTNGRIQEARSNNHEDMFSIPYVQPFAFTLIHQHITQSIHRKKTDHGMRTSKQDSYSFCRHIRRPFHHPSDNQLHVPCPMTKVIAPMPCAAVSCVVVVSQKQIAHPLFVKRKRHHSFMSDSCISIDQDRSESLCRP